MSPEPLGSLTLPQPFRGVKPIPTGVASCFGKLSERFFYSFFDSAIKKQTLLKNELINEKPVHSKKTCSKEQARMCTLFRQSRCLGFTLKAGDFAPYPFG
jgi:hypothetical protein